MDGCYYSDSFILNISFAVFNRKKSHTTSQGWLHTLKKRLSCCRSMNNDVIDTWNYRMVWKSHSFMMRRLKSTRQECPFVLVATPTLVWRSNPYLNQCWYSLYSPPLYLSFSFSFSCLLRMSQLKSLDSLTLSSTCSFSVPRITQKKIDFLPEFLKEADLPTLTLGMFFSFFLFTSSV